MITTTSSFPIRHLILWLSLAAVQAEDAEPEEVRFHMIGAAGRTHEVELKSTPGTGITVNAHESGPAETIATYASELGSPLFTYHSSELGQLAIVQYRVGGGTGVSYSRYMVIGCLPAGCKVAHEGLAEFVSAAPAVPEGSFLLQSEFEGIEKGFAQIVRVARPARNDKERHRPISNEVFGPVELRFRVEAGEEGLVVQREIDRNSAHALVDLLESGFPPVAEWAATVVREQWPEMEDALNDTLATAPIDRGEKIRSLRAGIDGMVRAPQKSPTP